MLGWTWIRWGGKCGMVKKKTPFGKRTANGVGRMAGLAGCGHHGMNSSGMDSSTASIFMDGAGLVLLGSVSELKSFRSA